MKNPLESSIRLSNVFLGLTQTQNISEQGTYLIHESMLMLTHKEASPYREQYLNYALRSDILDMADNSRDFFNVLNLYVRCTPGASSSEGEPSSAYDSCNFWHRH